MARLFGHYVPREMVFLLLADLVALGAGLPVPLTLVAPLLPGVGWPIGNTAAFVAIASVLIAAALGLYRVESCFDRQRSVPVAIAGGLLGTGLLGSGLIGGAVGGAPFSFPAVLHRGGLWLTLIVTIVICLAVTRLGFRWALRQNVFCRRILVIGSGHDVARACQAVRAEQAGRLEFAGAATILQSKDGSGRPPAISAERLRRDRIWGVLVGAEARREMPLEWLLGLRALGIQVFGGTDLQERHLRRVDIGSLDALSLAELTHPRAKLHDAAGRALDLAVCVALLVLTLPLMLLTALLIKLDSRGPVFYCQERVGQNGAHFRIFKFRSMRADAEGAGVPTWAVQDDPRVTRVGRWIRFARIDELPQLLNVLRGKMRLVGPRPERPHFVQELERVIPGYAARAQVKPGITGWAQVNYPYGASIEDARMKLAYDLYYVKHRSLFLDLLIVLETVRVVLFREGAR
jgi:exopolysaccharide biosynthesis polyprenyl glycosylphosphotransferase